MRKQICKKIFSFAFSCLMVMSSLYPAVAFAENKDSSSENAVYIKSAEDFTEFAKQCASDTYSKGKTFYLTEDIDLTDVDFDSIPIFCGTFEGGSHSINGVKITSTGSNKGLFRFVDNNAVIKNLKVVANVEPVGSMENLGIICGTNRGTIYKVIAEGYISGETNVGAIAGVNEESGVIDNSISNAEVFGNKNIGGIAGKNKGIIKASTSQCYINTDADRTAVNTGGIAGENIGSIESCYNYGNIGYKHSGYNVGGIAGIQNGIIIDSANYAQIKGRKDVGGIVGQFEPNIKMSYGAEKGAELKREIQKLNSLFNSISSEITGVVNKELSSVEAINGCMNDLNFILNDSAQYFYYDITDTSREITEYIEEMEEMGYDISHSSDKLASSVTGAVIRVQKAFDKLLNTLDRIFPSPVMPIDTMGSNDETDDIDEFYLRDELDIPDFDMSRIDPDNMTSDLSEVIAAVTDFISEIQDIYKDLDHHLDGFISSMDGSVGTVAGGIAGIQRSIDYTLDDQMYNMSETTDQITYYVDRINSEVDVMASNGKNSMNRIRGISDNISNQIDKVVNTVSDVVKVPEFSIKDVSEMVNQKPEPGEIRKCHNYGQVKGDSNTGGVVGIMAKELSKNQEEDLLSADKIMVDTTAIFKALILESTNNARVEVKNKYGGGVAGKADIGAICESINKGDVYVDTGDFCGGIAGSSKGSILNCYVQAVLEGNNNVGGIVGYGNNVKECYAMSVIKSEGEKIGSIAGYVEGDLENNYFVDEGNSAVDGVNYSGKAFPMSYEQFKEIEEIPSNFFNYGVNFIVNGNTLKTISVDYDGSIDEREIPKVPLREGYFGEWEEFDKDHIKRTIDVNAVYTLLTTTVTSDEDIPLVLIQGEFSPFAEIKVDKVESYPNIKKNEEIIASYKITVEDPEREVDKNFKIRLKTPESENIRVMVSTGEEYASVPFEMDGTYAVIDGLKSCQAVIVKNAGAPVLIIVMLSVIAVIALIIIIVAAFLIYQAKKEKRPVSKNKKSKNAEDDYINADYEAASEKTTQESNEHPVSEEQMISEEKNISEENKEETQNQ